MAEYCHEFAADVGARPFFVDVPLWGFRVVVEIEQLLHAARDGHELVTGKLSGIDGSGRRIESFVAGSLTVDGL